MSNFTPIFGFYRKFLWRFLSTELSVKSSENLKRYLQFCEIFGKNLGTNLIENMYDIVRTCQEFHKTPKQLIM